MKTGSFLQCEGLNNGNSRSGFVTRAGWLAAALFCSIALPATASVVYVNANQTNNVPDGTSWTTAFPKVQQAVDAADCVNWTAFTTNQASSPLLEVDCSGTDTRQFYRAWVLP